MPKINLFRKENSSNIALLAVKCFVLQKKERLEFQASFVTPTKMMEPKCSHFCAFAGMT